MSNAEKEFINSQMAWAKGILAQESYTMPNGKNSHRVAYEVLNTCLDRMPYTHSINAFGNFC